MDACDPKVDIKNLKRLIKQNTGVELKLTRNQICNAYSSIQANKLPLPPLVLSKDGRYMIDRKSPLNEKDFEVLFSASSTLSQLKRVARKTGLVNYNRMTKGEIIDSIGSFLQSKNVHEPIRIRMGTAVRTRVVSTPTSMRTVSVNKNEYPNNLNVNNVNGNGIKNNINANLENISREASNVANNIVTPNNGTRERTPNNGAVTPPVKKTPNYYNWFAREKARRQVNEKTQRGENTLKNVIKKLGRSPDPRSRNLMTQIDRALKSNNKSALEQIRKTLGVTESRTVNNKQKKVTELEKYMVNRARKLKNGRVNFMNKAQNIIKRFKNGNDIYNVSKERISALYTNALSTDPTVVDQLKAQVNSIENNKIKAEGYDYLKQFTATGSKLFISKIDKLKEIDTSKSRYIGNSRNLNELVNRALKNIRNSVNNRGLTKIETIFDTNNGNTPNSNLTKPENSKLTTGELNTIRKQLDNLKVNRNAKEQNIQKLKNELAKSTSPNVRNKLQANLNQALRNQVQSQLEYQALQTEKNRKNALYAQLKSEKLNTNAEIQSLRNKLNTNKSLSNEEKRALQQQLNEALGNKSKLNNQLKKSENEKMNYMRQMNTLAENVRKQKENANTEIKSLRNKLNTNKSLSNDEKRALQEQLNEALGNKSKLNNQLKKSENEKMNYMRQMNALAENVRKQKENANTQMKILENQLGKATTPAEREEIEKKLRNTREEANMWKKRLIDEQEKLREAQTERESYRANLESRAIELKAEQNARRANIEAAAVRESQIMKSIEEKNASINALTQERQKLMNQGKLNANNKARLEQIKLQLEAERNTKNNELRRLQNLSNQREEELKKLSTQLNALTTKINRKNALIDTQQQSIDAKNKNLLKRQQQVGNLYRNKNTLTEQVKILTQRAANTNTQIQKQIENIQSSTAKIDTLQKELSNATEKRARNIQNMQARHAENIRARVSQIEALSANVQRRNQEILKLQEQVRKSTIAGAWKGAAVRGLGTQMKNTRTNLNRAQKEIGVARGVVEGLVGQRQQVMSNLEKSRLQGAAQQQVLQQKLNNTSKQKNVFRQKLRNVQQQRGQLRKEVGVARGAVEGLVGQRQELQQKLAGATLNQRRAGNQIVQARKTARNMRAQVRTEKQPNFNATAAFQRMGNRLNQEKRQMLQIEKNKLMAFINSKRPNGNFTIGGTFGKIRRDLKSELNRITQMGELGRFKLKVNKAKNMKNTEIARKRMNKVLNQPQQFRFGNRNKPAQTRSQLLEANKLRVLSQL